MSKPRQKFCVFRTFLLLKASWCRAQLSKAGAREELDAFTWSLSWSRYLWSLAYCNRPHETLCGLLVCVGSRRHVLSCNQNWRQFRRQDVLVCQLHIWLACFSCKGANECFSGQKEPWWPGGIPPIKVFPDASLPFSSAPPPLSFQNISAMKIFPW